MDERVPEAWLLEAVRFLAAFQGLPQYQPPAPATVYYIAKTYVPYLDMEAARVGLYELLRDDPRPITGDTFLRLLPKQRTYRPAVLSAVAPAGTPRFSPLPAEPPPTGDEPPQRPEMYVPCRNPDCTEALPRSAQDPYGGYCYRCYYEATTGRPAGPARLPRGPGP